jgi:acyl-CoA synthetase (NDP forming)
VAYLGGADVERAERLLFHEKKIAVFPTPERAVKALSCHIRFDRDRFPLSVEGAGHGKATGAGTTMTPADSMAFLGRAGFPLTRFGRAGTEDEAVAAARGIGFPVAVKMNSPDVTHKSDAGGVFLDVADDGGVRAAFRAIRAAEGRLGVRTGGALVCAMAPAGNEVIVGVTKDPQFGHAVMFGLGGIFVEVMKDVSFRVAPLSEKDAVGMIREIRGYRALTGLRGKPAGDVDALRALLLRVSAFLASHPEIEEMDLNPVIVHARGLSIADARVVLRA